MIFCKPQKTLKGAGIEQRRKVGFYRKNGKLDDVTNVNVTTSKKGEMKEENVWSGSLSGKKPGPGLGPG